MNREEFSNEMNRLVSQFGKAAYSPERANLIWREVKDLSPSWMNAAIDEFIGSSRQPPLMPEFRERIAIEREKQWSRQKQQSQKDSWNPRPDCKVCSDNGVYICVKADGSADGFWAFRCHCVKGCNDPRKMIPQYKADHAKEFVYFDIEKHRQEMAMVVLS